MIEHPVPAFHIDVSRPYPRSPLDRFHGYFVALNQVAPPASAHEGAKLSYGFFENDRGKESVWCLFHFLGFEMFTDPEIRKWQPPAIMPEDFASVLEF